MSSSVSPASGARKSARSGADTVSVKAAPQTRTPFSGSSTASSRGEVKTCTFSGRASLCQRPPGRKKSWLPGAMNTGTSISASARRSASSVSGHVRSLSKMSPESSTSSAPVSALSWARERSSARCSERRSAAFSSGRLSKGESRCRSAAWSMRIMCTSPPRP